MSARAIRELSLCCECRTLGMRRTPAAASDLPGVPTLVQCADGRLAHPRCIPVQELVTLPWSETDAVRVSDVRPETFARLTLGGDRRSSLPVASRSECGDLPNDCEGDHDEAKKTDELESRPGEITVRHGVATSVFVPAAVGMNHVGATIPGGSLAAPSTQARSLLPGHLLRACARLGAAVYRARTLGDVHVTVRAADVRALLFSARDTSAPDSHDAHRATAPAVVTPSDRERAAPELDPRLREYSIPEDYVSRSTQTVKGAAQ